MGAIIKGIMKMARRCGPRPVFLLVVAALVPASLSATELADRRPSMQDLQLAQAEIISYRLEITGGDVHVRVAGSCRILKVIQRLSSDDRWISFNDQAPLQLDVSGAAVECFVRKVKGDGTMEVTLRRGSDPIAHYTLVTRKHQLRLRSVGPWGVGGVRVLPVGWGAPVL